MNIDSQLISNAIVLNNYFNKNFLKEEDLVDFASLQEIESFFDDLSINLNMPKKDVITAYELLASSIFAFTKGHVASVRDNSLFDISKVMPIDFIDNEMLSSYRYLTKKSSGIDKQDYINAKKFLSIASRIKTIDNNSSTDLTKIMRGLNNISLNLLNAWIRPGAEFDLGDIVSATIDKYTALHFSSSRSDEKPTYLLLNISNPNQIGIYVEGFSAYPHEKEVIVSGQVKTLSTKGRIYRYDSTNKKYNSVKSYDWEEIYKFHKFARELNDTQREKIFNDEIAHLQPVIIDCELVRS